MSLRVGVPVLVRPDTSVQQGTVTALMVTIGASVSFSSMLCVAVAVLPHESVLVVPHQSMSMRTAFALSPSGHVPTAFQVRTIDLVLPHLGVATSV